MNIDNVRSFFIAVFLLFTLPAAAQGIKFTPLESPENGALLKPNETIIYGSFLRRPGIWYDYTQAAVIRNIDTKEKYSIVFDERVKGSKEHSFCFNIKAGSYEIMYLIYKKAKWYGDLQTITPVFKNIDYNINVKAKVDSGLMDIKALRRFTFKIDGTGLYYLGKWHFETGVVFFDDDKATLDKKLPEDFYFLKFNEAATVIPN